MAIFDVARDIYLVAKDDEELADAVRAERASLAASIITDGGAFELTSTTVAGQSFSGTRSMTKAQRLRMLGLVVTMLDNEANFSSESKAYFAEN